MTRAIMALSSGTLASRSTMEATVTAWYGVTPVLAAAWSRPTSPATASKPSISLCRMVSSSAVRLNS